ncbi:MULTISPECIES: SRPBCC family protein [Tsukamurella]|uniref:Polyketide cyclase/dehydrase n=2 Tax=Tsukamurella TaxID=2060 RepID=A0A5C5RRJ2_9ACTN|nr:MULTISPECIES: SRPBCC family protein [Tsukamurella]NMD57002.1 polyketide cyclase/dehydrase [Tsukamurella columbiensis]TWS25689.1 polyketide cyclase/dehydrase [Tsukamurella conjunctivitidis]
MITKQQTVHTSAPASAVFAYLADFTNAQEWDPNAVAVARLTGDGGVGSTYRVTSTFAGARTDLDYELTELEPTSLIRLRGHKSSLTAVDTITIAPTGSGSAVTYAVEFAFHGVFRLLEPVLTLAVNKLFADGAKGLSAHLEKLA